MSTRRLFLVWALLLAGIVCLAQQPTKAYWQSRDSNYNINSASGGGGYVGPGDLSLGTFKSFWSCRAFSAATAGTKAYRLIRSSDSTQTDINSTAGGLCDTTTPATFCAATTCFYAKWYDQSGAAPCLAAACDLTPQPTIGVSPAWTAASLNGWPCITAAGTAGESLWSVAAGFTQAQPLTMLALWKRTNTSNFMPIIGFNTNNITWYFRNTANTSNISLDAPSTVTASASDNAFHAGIAVANNASSAIVIDGSATTGSVAGTTGPTAQNFTLIGDSSGSQYIGSYCEAGLISAALNSTQYGNLNSNMHSATNGWNF